MVKRLGKNFTKYQIFSSNFGDLCFSIQGVLAQTFNIKTGVWWEIFHSVPIAWKMVTWWQSNRGQKWAWWANLHSNSATHQTRIWVWGGNAGSNAFLAHPYVHWLMVKSPKYYHFEKKTSWDLFLFELMKYERGKILMTKSLPQASLKSLSLSCGIWIISLPQNPRVSTHKREEIARVYLDTHKSKKKGGCKVKTHEEKREENTRTFLVFFQNQNFSPSTNLKPKSQTHSKWCLETLRTIINSW